MADQITIQQALELVEFEPCPEGWRVKNVKGSVYGDVCSNVYGDVCSNVYGNVCGDVRRDVWGNVCGNVRRNVCGDVRRNVFGTIGDRQWKFVETPRDKLKRLIEEGADKEQLLEAFNQLEDSNG